MAEEKKIESANQQAQANVERARLEKELANAAKQLQAQIGKLSNQNFVTRAPEAVVNAEREKQAKLEALIENLKLNLSHLS